MPSKAKSNGKGRSKCLVLSCLLNLFLIAALVSCICLIQYYGKKLKQEKECQFKDVVNGCRCAGKEINVGGVSKCYSSEKCSDVDEKDCGIGLNLVDDDDEECPKCGHNYCAHKQMVEGCHCNEGNKVQLADSLFYCNKGASKCQSGISFGNCPENRIIDYKINRFKNELEGCPVCKLRECEELETFGEENDCHCEGGTTLKLKEGLNYCNKGAKKCDVNVNFDNCKNPNQVLNYALSNGQKSLNGCPTCDLRICEHLQEVQDCKCDNKTVYNTVNDKTYCIDHNECDDLKLNGDGKCTDGIYPFFFIELNLLVYCPKCPDESCRKIIPSSGKLHCIDNCDDSKKEQIEKNVGKCPEKILFIEECESSCPDGKKKIVKRNVIIAGTLIICLILILIAALIFATIKMKKKNSNGFCAYDIQENSPQHCDETVMVKNDKLGDCSSKSGSYQKYTEKRYF